MEKFEAWALTILMVTVILAIPTRILVMGILALLALPLAFLLLV